MLTRDKPEFSVEGRHWPHRDKSRFIQAADLRFHIQEFGPVGAPKIVLVHGTGASTHSFRAVAPLLADDFRVIAFDLPGHGFTETPFFTRMTLPGVADACAALLHAIGDGADRPAALVGHSAGVPIALEMALDGKVKPLTIIGFNASVRPFAGAAGPIFSTLAKVLFANPLTPRVFAASATPRRVAKLLSDTGSPLDEEGRGYYHALFRRAGHVAGALGLMAGWDLVPLQKRLGQLSVPLTLAAASGDRTIAPSVSREAIEKVPNGHLVRIAALGHLAHEEDPAGAARIIRDAIARAEADRPAALAAPTGSAA